MGGADVAKTQRFQVDQFPPVMLKQETRSCYRILHELTGTFRVHLGYRVEKVAKVNGWGFDITKVKKWSWSVGYQSGPSIRYVHAYHEFDDREQCLEVAVRIALQWIHADDRREVWRSYLIESDGEYGRQVFESSQEMERAVAPESGWD